MAEKARPTDGDRDFLAQEMAVYAEKLPDLLQDAGRHVVIFKDNVVGIFNDYEDALAAGYKAAKDEPFLVKRIEQTDAIHHFTRVGIFPCHT